jgi:hypothetical protein
MMKAQDGAGTQEQIMKMLLHIGAHKTGSSSVQFFMHQNYAKLLDMGILYPQSGISRFGHHPLALSCKPKQRQSEKVGLGLDGELDAILREIGSSPAERCVLSSEEFFVTDPQKIERVASALSGHDVRILAFVRRPDTMFMSIYTGRLRKSNIAHTDYQRLLSKPEQISQDLLFERQINNWARVFGRENIELRCVETGDSVEAVMRAIGIEPMGPIGLELREGLSRRNSSMPSEALTVLKLAKETIEDTTAFKRVQKYCRAQIPAARSLPFLSPAERRQIVSYFEESNNRLFASFGYSTNPYSVENLDVTNDAEFFDLNHSPQARKILSEALSDNRAKVRGTKRGIGGVRAGH